MKAILLAGGKGTRLRPLTIHTPKPIVPIFERPFLHYQLDLLKRVPEIDEVILSLNYQPRRIEEIFGDGSDSGLALRYVVEPAPLGTAGAVRYAGESIRESVVVFNGDVLTQVDLKAVIALHRARKAKASIVRSFFPSLIERGETFVAYVYRGYWIDIGTPEKYMQVHRDIMDGRYNGRRTGPFANGHGTAWVSPQARVDSGVTIEG